MPRESTRSRLIELMSAYNLTQSDIAKKTGIPKSAISMYINGYRVPRQDKLSLIADAYGVDPAWLMGYDIPMVPMSSNDSFPDFSPSHLRWLKFLGKLSEEQSSELYTIASTMADNLWGIK